MTATDADPARGPELTTVADDLAVVHHGRVVRRYEGLRPGTEYRYDGISFRTLERPGGERLATVATVNDVHFGETECGHIEGLDAPVFTAPDGAEPYPETMNRAAAAEIAAIGPDAVVVKGDLTSTGARVEYDAFLRCYGMFGERLHHVRGNHDAYAGHDHAPEGPRLVTVPGLALALLDTTVPGHTNGSLDAGQLAWLDEVAGEARGRVLVLGHHHVWDPHHDLDVDWYFGLRPRASEALIARLARHPRLVGYVAGHTHRNRVIRLPETGAKPWGEVASTKDFPGSWAEYRVFEGGVLQVHHRISTPEALAWSELTRACYAPYLDYTTYALGQLGDRCYRVC